MHLSGPPRLMGKPLFVGATTLLVLFYLHLMFGTSRAPSINICQPGQPCYVDSANKADAAATVGTDVGANIGSNVGPNKETKKIEADTQTSVTTSATPSPSTSAPATSPPTATTAIGNGFNATTSTSQFSNGTSTHEDTETPEPEPEEPGSKQDVEEDVDPWQRWLDYKQEFDPADLSLDRDQCKENFPKILEELERPRTYYSQFRIIDDDINAIKIEAGRVRASIRGGRLFIEKSNLPEPKHRAIALATLQSLHDALTGTKEVFRNMDFVLSVIPFVKDITIPLWVFNRREGDDKVFLMPYANDLFGFDPLNVPSDTLSRMEEAAIASGVVLSKDGQDPGKRREFIRQSRLAEIGGTREAFFQAASIFEKEHRWTNKEQNLVASWPVSNPPTSRKSTQIRELLDRQTFGAEWSTHENPEDKSSSTKGFGPALSGTGSYAEALCQHQFIFLDPSFGTDFFDGPALCASVTLMKRVEWRTIYHRVITADESDPASGDNYHPNADKVVETWQKDQPDMETVNGTTAGDQNVVVVRNDLEDLDVKMQALRKMPKIGERIAINQAMDFRGRYMTRAANACYWREIIRVWSENYNALEYDLETNARV